jgi:hypothetical protein
MGKMVQVHVIVSMNSLIFRATVSVHSRFNHWEIGQVVATSQIAVIRATTGF